MISFDIYACLTCQVEITTDYSASFLILLLEGGGVVLDFQNDVMIVSDNSNIN